MISVLLWTHTPKAHTHINTDLRLLYRRILLFSYCMYVFKEITTKQTETKIIQNLTYLEGERERERDIKFRSHFSKKANKARAEECPF